MEMKYMYFSDLKLYHVLLNKIYFAILHCDISIILDCTLRQLLHNSIYKMIKSKGIVLLRKSIATVANIST